MRAEEGAFITDGGALQIVRRVLEPHDPGVGVVDRAPDDRRDSSVDCFFGDRIEQAMDQAACFAQRYSLIV